MKRLLYLLSTLLMLFLYTCTMDEGIMPDPTGGADLKSAHSQGAVITVNPSGGDDTQAIIEAFNDAKAAGPGSVVKLVEGQYSIKPIEVLDFYGCFQGAGIGKTILTNMPGIPCNDFWVLDICPYLLQFINGDITVSDMTIHINDGSPCDGPQMYSEVLGDLLTTVLVLADYSPTYMPANRHIKGVVKNLEFIPGNIGNGTNPYGRDGNVNMTLYCGPNFMIGTGHDPLCNGDITVTNCIFKGSTTGPDIAAFGKNSTVNIENNFMEGNIYGTFMCANLGSMLTVKNNKFQDGVFMDLYIDDYDYGLFPSSMCEKRTEWRIEGNEFQGTTGEISLYLGDNRRTAHPEEGFPQLFEIKGNSFNTQEGGTAIFGLNNVDARIWNNKFTGTGYTGVFIDGDAASNTFAENNSLTGNNFFGVTYSEAAVYLGQYSMNCKVAGVSGDNVVDLGQNNSVIGTKAHKNGPHYSEMGYRFPTGHGERINPHRP